MASYTNDYIKFEKLNLNRLLVARFLKNEIQVSLPHDERPGDMAKDSPDACVLYPRHHNAPMFDSNGNIIISDVGIKPFEIDTTTVFFQPTANYTRKPKYIPYQFNTGQIILTA